MRISDWSSDVCSSDLFVGVILAVILVVLNWRQRMIQLREGIEGDSIAAFAAKTGLASALIVAFSYMLATYRGLPNVLVIMFALIMFYRFVTNRTVIGRRIYALGGNIKAAKLSGIKTERLTFYTFVNMGVLAALAGLIFAARLNTATPKAGLGFELDVIAACFIGGASASGGVGRVTGAVVGALIMGEIGRAHV